MAETNTSIDRLTIRHFWQVGRHYRREYWLAWLIPINVIAVYTLLPFYVGKILASLTRPHVSIRGYAIGFVVTAVIGVVANRIGFVALMNWIPKVMAALQADCLDMLLHRGTTFHNNNVSGKLVSEFNDYPNAYNNLASAFFTNIVPFITSLLSGLLLISISSPLLGLLMLLMSVMAVGSGIWQRRRMVPFRQKRIKASKDVIAHSADTIVNIHAVKTFAREAEEQAEYGRLSDVLLNTRLHDWRLVAITGSNRITLLLVFEFAYILLISWLVHRDPHLLATGIFAFSYTVTLTNRLFEVGTMMRQVEEALLLAEPMTRALGETIEVQDIPHAADLQVTAGAIRFEQVGFHYDDTSGKDKVFDGLNLTIAPGERIGLVGPSGGGKSTITKLLLRFEDIQHGSIVIDDQNIADVTQAGLRSAIAYVPQESLLFHRTVGENIAYGNPLATEAAIRRAAQAAYAHDFIMKLPHGYETVVGERGVKLSGGQRQRIAIARAMVKQAPLLILDEATSALDSDSEKVIQKALWELMKDKTALVIAHRLSTIQRLDRIIVLDDGKIVEQGTHAELLEQAGLYARLWSHQSGGFMDG